MNKGEPISRNSLAHGSSAEEVSDFLCRDLHEIQQKMSELGLTASYERASASG
jgi:hypothetical protein